MMSPDLVAMIQKLSLADQKTLVQKTLKASEELGELAKAVLPYENAYATTHRFSDRAAILDNVADLLLCVLSIGFDVNYEMSEIEEHVRQKSLKWADLQHRETKAKWPVPFELHVSVKDADISTFKDTCAAIGVKPLLLALQTKDNGALQDVMTSHVHMGNNQSVYEELQRVSNGLKAAGFNVVREKIEAAPWHPMAPTAEHVNPVMPPNCYFECHVGVICTKDRLTELNSLCSKNDLHVSRNVFKVNADETIKVMVTYRVYTGTLESFNRQRAWRTEVLVENGFRVDKTTVEFAVYDTKISHDAAWLKAD